MGAGINGRVKRLLVSEDRPMGMACTAVATETRYAVARDPNGTLDAARGRVLRARKSAGRLFVSGIGFSVAYFLDPDHGKTRRKRALDLMAHVRRSRSESLNGDSRVEGPTVVDGASLPPATSNGAVTANGVRSTARW
jgi:hypothetical protein